MWKVIEIYFARWLSLNCDITYSNCTTRLIAEENYLYISQILDFVKKGLGTREVY